MLKGKFTRNPRSNVIDKVILKIFDPVWAFKRRFENCFVIFQVNKYVYYFIHPTINFVLTR